jgi:hypothetical protein
MSISTVSFTRTPQAGDDIYGWSEDALIGSGLLNGTRAIAIWLPA